MSDEAYHAQQRANAAKNLRDSTTLDEVTTMLNAAQKILDLTIERDKLRSIVERLAASKLDARIIITYDNPSGTAMKIPVEHWEDLDALIHAARKTL